jgi:hypothetical protein
VVDYVTFEVRGLQDDMAPVTDHDDVVFSFIAALEARLSLIPRLQLMITAGAEIPVRSVHYVVQTPDGGEELLLDAWPVQPWIFVGLAVDLL